MFRADLHCHTTCSDGTFTPEELLKHAQEIGLSGLSITDHDTLDAYASAIPYAHTLGIRLGAGIELSTVFQMQNVHVLAYDFLLDSPQLLELLQRHSQRRVDRNRMILQKLKENKMPIDDKELLDAAHTIGRPHIAVKMVSLGYVRSVREAFDKYLGEGKLCYVAGEPISLAETLDVVHSSQGKAFLAHPHLIRRRRLLREILKLPFDGIECYYGNFPRDACEKWVQIARDKKWLISGGSDFHGTLRPELSLGRSWIDEEKFATIFQRTL
jgi:predicted metal-dependent phosphoesterase TrpH